LCRVVCGRSWEVKEQSAYHSNEGKEGENGRGGRELGRLNKKKCDEGNGSNDQGGSEDNRGSAQKKGGDHTGKKQV